MKSAAHIDVSRVHVLDGGMATELEWRGCNIYGPLWSAQVLDTAPGVIQQVHLNYLRAGADCISTVSYQISAHGYLEVGRTRDDAARELRRSVEIAEAAREEYARESERTVLIAASLGPYGAALHNGAEFHGRYAIGFDELVTFHAERLAIIAKTHADLVALETVPSLEEAHAIAVALAQIPSLGTWVSFTCRDEAHVAHGEMLADCMALLDRAEQVVAVGINCTHPRHVKELVGAAKAATNKPVFVYPNSGETWDAAARRWLGKSDVKEYGALAAKWFEAGAQAIGGCCRTTPAHIRAVRAAWQARQPAAMRQ
ncbi:MAG TPA: homocysteine S-methyltransferase [Silvibacterium sp.]|nr:homocysteine S-methyltransferase [Silvibacterium sp.]